MVKCRLNESDSERVDAARLIAPHVEKFLLADEQTARVLVRAFYESLNERTVFDRLLKIGGSKLFREGKDYVVQFSSGR